MFGLGYQELLLILILVLPVVIVVLAVRRMHRRPDKWSSAPAPQDDLSATVVRQPPSVKAAWIVAIAWALLTAIIAAGLPVMGDGGQEGLERAIMHLWSAGLVVSIALAVRRGGRLAGWALVAVAVLDAFTRLWVGAGGLLLPMILFAFALPAALYLHRHARARTEEEAWIPVLYELAFLQAALTAIVVVWSQAADPSTIRQVLGLRFGVKYLIDVGILLALGLSAWKRLVWAGYGLVLYQLGNVYFWVLRSSTPEDLYIPLSMVVGYGLGAYHLYRASGPLTLKGRVSIAIIIGLFLSQIVLLTANRPTQYERISGEFVQNLLAVPGLKERFSARNVDAARLSRELVLRGARRLTDERLIERTRLLSIILKALDAHNCAEQLRGGRGSIEPGLRKVDSATLRAWFDLALEAMVVEHQGNAPIVPNPSEEEIAEAMEGVMEILPADDQARFLKISSEGGESFEKATDEDTCWFFRTMLEHLPRVSRVHQATIARLVVAQ